MGSTHVLDRLSLGKIVQIREQLLRARAAGARVYRLESGDALRFAFSCDGAMVRDGAAALRAILTAAPAAAEGTTAADGARTAAPARAARVPTAAAGAPSAATA